MIRHRVFIFFTAIVIMLFILFQFLMMNLIWSDNWVVNKSTDDLRVEKLQDHPIKNGTKKGMYSYYVISSDSEAENFINIKRALELFKFSFEEFSSLNELPEAIPAYLTCIIICDGNLDLIGDMEILKRYLTAGVDSFFTNRFDVDSAVYQQNTELFGIETNEGPYEQEGVDFLNDVLVSGLFFDADITEDVNLVTLSGKCKVYAVGVDENIKQYYDKNPIIWRTHLRDGGAMYFFNADLMKNFYNIGVFIGMLSSDKDDFIYPVVNASLILLDGMPYLSNENDSNMKNVYIRNTLQVQRDVIWNDLMAITKGIKMKYTLYPKTGIGVDFYEKNFLQALGKEVYANNFEIALYPSNNFNSILKNYTPSAAMHYPSDKASSQVVFNGYDFSFTNNTCINLPIITEGHDLGKREKYIGFSYASALGYFSHYLNLSDDIFGDTSGSDIWTDYKLKFVQGTYPVLKTYEYLTPETASDTAKKMSAYLNCAPDYYISRDDTSGAGTITIKKQPEGTLSYMVKTVDKVVSAEGCEYLNVGRQYYFVTVTGDADAVLHIEKEDKTF